MIKAAIMAAGMMSRLSNARLVSDSSTGSLATEEIRKEQPLILYIVGFI